MNQIERSGNNASATVLNAPKDKAGWLVIGGEETNSISDVDIQRNITVYPNPVAEVLFFNNNLNEELLVKIINLQGLTVKQEKGRIRQINVGNLPAGIYFISINGKTQVIVKK
jgi:hypothetical protein